jgi:hypothetical protein
MAVSSPFQWGMGGQAITSPEQAARKRAIAEALIAQSSTPGNNWSEGLADIAAALSGTVLEGRVSEAEAAGRERAGGLFADLAVNADPNSIIAALTSPDAAWASPAQTSIASALLQSGLERQDPMYQAQLAKLQAEASGGGNDETFFGTPLYTTDAEGNMYVNQLGNQGTLSPITLPEGQILAPVTKEIDTGTEIITYDRNGNELFRTPKQLRQAAYETGFGGVEGKTEAENIAAAESIASKLPGLRGVVAELGELAKKATYTQTGQLIDNVMRETGQEPSEAAIARARYIAMVDNQVLPLLRDTFGAAFTQKEGETLRATLGNPNASPAEKQAILDAFIAQKERDVAGMMSNMPGGTPVQGATTPSPQVRVFNPATGRLE